MVVTPLCSRRRRVSRRNNLLDSDVRHIATYLCAAKLTNFFIMAKKKHRYFVYLWSSRGCWEGLRPYM